MCTYFWYVYSSGSYRTGLQHKCFTCITYRKSQYSHGHGKFLPPLYENPAASRLTRRLRQQKWFWFAVCPLDIQLDAEISICLSYRNNSRFCLYASFDETWPKVLVLTITFGFGLAKLDPKIKSNPAAKIFCATHNFVQC